MRCRSAPVNEVVTQSSYGYVFLTLIVKKPGLDQTSTSSYRPISILSVLSKPLERIVAHRSWTTSSSMIYFRPFNLVSVELSSCYQIYVWQSTVVTSGFWFCWTSLSAAFDTVVPTSCYNDLRQHSVFGAWCYAGSSRISLNVTSVLDVAATSHRLPLSTVESAEVCRWIAFVHSVYSRPEVCRWTALVHSVYSRPVWHR